MNLKHEADQIQDYMVAFRRELHMYPELSFEEFETTNRIERELNKLGLTCHRFEPTGLMADIKGEGEGDVTVALRADIDALPMDEETGFEYASKIPGKMHSCGHDAHAAMLLGAAKLLVEHKADFGGTVRLLFQPAEEAGNGAQTIIDQGAADGVDYFFGMHVMEFQPVGVFAGRPGPQMAGAESFKVLVKGHAHHAGMPHLADGVDATLTACEIVTAFQSIVARRLNPFDVAVVSVGTLHSGTRSNIISGLAEMEGTIRYQSQEIREKIKQHMINMSEGIAKAHGLEAEIIWGQNINPVINDEYAISVAFDAAKKVTGSENGVKTVIGTTGAEDFGSYSRCGKAAFMTIGVMCPGNMYPGHSPKFHVNEDAFPYGAAVLAQVALDILNK